jgi:hypothetical protein
MPETNVELTTKKQDYEKPVIKKIGSVSELTMAVTNNVAHNFDSGNDPFYS